MIVSIITVVLEIFLTILMGLVIVLTILMVTPRVCADSIANYEDEEELGEHLEAAHSTVMAALRATLTPTLTS